MISGVCRYGWSYLKSSHKCYRHFDEETNWGAAKYRCKNTFGGRLAMPKTSDINRKLDSMSYVKYTLMSIIGSECQ